MAMKIYRHTAHTPNGCIVSTTREKKKPWLVSSRAFGLFTKRKHHDVNQRKESRSSTSNESARTTELETRDCNEAQEEHLHDDDVTTMFEHIDELVSSLMTTKPTIKKVKTKIKVKSLAKENKSPFFLSRAANSKPESSAQHVHDPPTQNDALYMFKCFGCGEFLENFTNNLACRELNHIQVWEGGATFEDGSDMSALTDLSANLATDLIFLPNSKTVYADNARARTLGRKGLNMSIKDDLSYVSFGPIENVDEIAVEALARDDISLSFVGRLESLSEC